VALSVVPQSSRKRRDKLLKTLSLATQRATGKTFAKQVASTATESRTKFQLSLTAVATVSYGFCPLHGMLNDAMFHTTHLSRRHRKH